MITDRPIDAVWLTHAGGTASIGGVAYTSATMAQVSGDELTMQVAGSADPTGKASASQAVVDEKNDVRDRADQKERDGK